MIGKTIGPYQIIDKLGEGGMGQVFKARDTRLDRLVAIKQSATEFSDRFEREARAVAALNHPNICQVYDVGPDYFVMEFLEGRPLAPVEGTRKVLDLAVQIADGMAAAHAASIVHRDLKPDNLLVTPDGRVKILDFGIAKATADAAGDQHTRATLTGAGTAVGTVYYMSPEQARGLAAIGPQSDQFSFGLILYELVTGKKAFARESSAETLTAIIREDAAPLPATVPAPLRWIIERLLAKDPSERYESSRDLYRELKQLRDRLSDAAAPLTGATVAASVAPVPSSRVRWLVPLVAALALAAVASALTWALVPRGGVAMIDQSAYRLTPISLDARYEDEPVWSPDGRALAYTANVGGFDQLMVRDVGSTTAVQLTKAPFDVRDPIWARDGARLYFMRGNVLFSVSAVGGEAERVVDRATSAALNPRDGRIVFARASSLLLLDPSVGTDGREPQPFGQIPFKGTLVVLGFSPDGAKLLVAHDGTLWLLAYPVGTGREIRLDETFSGFVSWMPDSRHFVTTRLQGRGVGLSIVDSETRTWRTILTSPLIVTSPSVSPDGSRIAFAIGDPRSKLVEVSLPDGRVRELGGGSSASMFPSLSPDGSRLAFSDNSVGPAASIFEMTLSATGETVTKTLTEIEGRGIEHVLWSPDGARLLFTTLAASEIRLMIAPATGGRPLPVDTAAEMSRGGVWSPDGTRIAYRRQVEGENQLVTIRVGTSAAPTVLKRWSSTEPNRLPLAWSPDGRWILTRQVADFILMAADGSSERRLSTSALYWEFARPAFSRDGREVWMLRRDAFAAGRPWKLYAIDVASGTERAVTTIGFPGTANNISGLSISLDGTRFYTSYADYPFDIWMLEGFR